MGAIDRRNLLALAGAASAPARQVCGQAPSAKGGFLPVRFRTADAWSGHSRRGHSRPISAIAASSIVGQSGRAMTDPRILVATSVRYYHQNDEAAFFGWLDRMPCVESYRGVGRDLLITLTRQPNKADLQELVSFFLRYEINLAQLACFETRSNRNWLRNPSAVWHDRMFGTVS